MIGTCSTCQEPLASASSPCAACAGRGTPPAAATAVDSGSCASCGSAWHSVGRFCTTCGAARTLTAAVPTQAAPVSIAAPVAAVSTVSGSQPAAAAAAATSGFTVPAPAVPAAPAQLSAVDRSIGARWSRGWRIAAMSLRLVRSQPGLIALPLAAAGASIVLLVLYGLTAGDAGGLLAFLFTVAVLVGISFIWMASQAMLAIHARALVRGQTLTHQQAWATLQPRLGAVARWTVIALSVGFAIRSLERSRLGFLVRLVGYALEVAWSASSFFVLPVLLFEDLNARPSLTRSRQIVRSCWGEGLVGVGALNIVFAAATVAGLLLCALLAAGHALLLAVLLFFAVIIGLNLLAAVTTPLYVVALYEFATANELVLGFAAADLAAAFRPRRRSLAFAAA